MSNVTSDSARADGLPPGWVDAEIGAMLTPLEDGRLLHHGWSPQCESEPRTDDSQWGVLKTTAIQDGSYVPTHNKRLPSNLAPKSNLEVHEGDLLLTCAGPRSRCGVPCLVRRSPPRLILSGKMYRFRVPEFAVSPAFLEAQLRAPSVQAAIDAMKTGISDSGLNLTHGQFLTLAMRLPPLPEQRRIVEALDTHFTRLDAAVGTLERVRANLKRYRAAVLQAAVEGRLVTNEAELARAERRSFESGSQVLQRALEERRSRFAARVGNYTEPDDPETTGLWPLPEGWIWATWEQASERVTVGHVGKMHYHDGADGVKFLRSQNVRENRFEPIGLQRISRSFHALLSKSALRPGDLLIVRSGAPGTTCVVPDFIVEANCADLVIVKQPIAVRSRFGAYFMNSLAKATVRRQRVGIAQMHFNTKSAAALPIPVPPIAEQERIIEAVERHLSDIDAMETATHRSLRQVARLRQSLLRLAFDGRLVPQDPHDEPASVLLDRICRERVADAATAKKKPARSRR